MVKGRAARTRPYSIKFRTHLPICVFYILFGCVHFLLKVCGKVVVVRIRQVVALGSVPDALGSVPETIDYGELQGLQALVVGGRWSLDTSGH